MAGLVDAPHLAVTSFFRGRGEHLLIGLDLDWLGYSSAEQVPAAAETRRVFRRV